MGSFYVGVSGLQTSQNALNTTAHNLSNIDTKGYTRQQVLQGNQIYNKIGEAHVGPMQIGLGVSYTDVRAIRDVFLDKSYRTQSGRSAYYSTSYDVINEINMLFGETEGTEFQNSIRELQNAITDLASKPTDPTTQGVVVTRAAQFLERAKAVYNGLVEYQDNLNEQIKDQVDQINEYADKIFELNQKIISIEAGKVEDANDLRDARDYILDKLAAMGRISYSEDAKGAVSVQFEGVDLVNGDYVNHMEAKILDEDSTTGFYSVVWPRMDDQQVFNYNQKISADIGSDNGSLKALLFSRGQGVSIADDNGDIKNRRATYEDITGGYKYAVEKSDGTKEYHIADDDYAYEQVQKSSLMTVMAEFDNLIHNITSGIDKLLTTDLVTDANGDPVLDPATGNYTYKENGNLPLFSLIATSSVTDPTLNSFYDDYTCSNLMVNTELLKQPTLLANGFVLSDQSADQDRANALVELFNNPDKVIDLFQDDKKYIDTVTGVISSTSTGAATEEKHERHVNAKVNLNATELTPLNFGNYYISIVDQYATVGNTYKSLSESQEQSVLTLENERQQVVGVSDNEELTKMIRFQNAYNASSRFMNTVNAMLENLLNNMGHL
ncbi:MAG: flagellar hook-associated protein FlgK [Lachnospiraceae bacterium]|nr:flagellar hook-associated protein FlgK [Lachnospiraceae bacterium]